MVSLTYVCFIPAKGLIRDLSNIASLNGIVNYPSCLLPSLSGVMKPLRDLTHKDVVCCWDDLQEKGVNGVENVICTWFSKLQSADVSEI